ncbi:MAG: Fur family transcriptional regulator [Phycisphaerales bacterium]
MRHLEPDQIRAEFSRREIRCTKQREDIYAVLCASESHPTAEEIFREVRSVQPGLSLATVYNTLETFTEHGLCRKVGLAPGAGGACRYDADMSHHVHLVNAAGDVRDVPGHLAEELISRISPELLRRLERELGVRVTRVNIDVLVDSRGRGGVDGPIS